MPDIDTPSSKIRKPVSIICLAVVIVSIGMFLGGRADIYVLFVALIFAVFPYLLWFAKHRRLYHTPAAALFFSVPLYLVSPVYCGFAFFGYISHLVLDE
ncbi:MAG: hypothetical protein ABH950_05400 [Candidatus Altiarchaeota archaeon]